MRFPRLCALACDISARCFERDKDVDILFASAPFACGEQPRCVQMPTSTKAPGLIER